MSALAIGLAVYAVGWVIAFVWVARRSADRGDYDVAMRAAEVAFVWPVVVWLSALALLVRAVRPKPEPLPKRTGPGCAACVHLGPAAPWTCHACGSMPPRGRA